MKEQPIDILCVGEILIDFIANQREKPIKEVKDYHRYLGGSPTNVAMNMARLGSRVELVATIGEDGFGDYINMRLEDNNVGTTGLKSTTAIPTTVIFVNRTENTPEFIPMRGADSHIESDQLSDALLSKCKIYHTSCFALSKEPARSAILEGAKKASALGLDLSIDINYSEQIWPNVEEAKQAVIEYCSYGPIIKASQDDIDRLFGAGMSHDEIFKYLHGLGARTVCLTMGKKGAKLSEPNSEVLSLSAMKVEKIMDATGAGDAFWSGFLFAKLKGHNNEKCMKTALQMAAIKLQNVGRIPDYADVISAVLNI